MLSFVLTCVAFYKAVIQGAYWGIALHTVSEINNESYVYYSSSDESEVCEKRSTKSSINDNNFRKGYMYNKDLYFKERKNVSLQNPEISNYSLSSQPYSKRGTHSQKNHDNQSQILENGEYQKDISFSSSKSKERKREIQINEQVLLGMGSGGTCVFLGQFHGREVAVKRMVHQHSEIA